MPTSSSTRFFLPINKQATVPTITTTPEEDHFLAAQFGYRSLNKRKENKRALLIDKGIKSDTRKPLVVILAHLFVSMRDKAILDELMSALSSLGVQLLIVVDTKYCSAQLLKQCLQLENNERNVHLALAAGDIVVLPPSVNTHLIKSCLDYGIVPVAFIEQDYIADYDPARESGNSFAYKSQSVWAIFAAIVRSLETYRLSYDWQRIQRNGMEV